MPVIRAFIGEEHPVDADYLVVLGVVGVSSAILSVVLVPVGRWCMRVKAPEWKAPREELV